MENYLDSKSERMNRINVSESRFICSISLQITNKTVNVICEMKGFVYISVLGYYNVIVVLYLYLIPSRFIVIIYFSSASYNFRLYVCFVSAFGKNWNFYQTVIRHLMMGVRIRFTIMVIIISSGYLSDGVFWFFNSGHNNSYFVTEQNNIWSI